MTDFLLLREEIRAAVTYQYMPMTVRRLLDRAGTALVEVGGMERQALVWLAEHPRCHVEHFGPVYGDDDDQSEGWRVMRENGSINDREWEEVGRGRTPLDAILAATRQEMAR